jgi:hypothetical protein
MLIIIINFSQRYFYFFHRNKVTVVLKLALLASNTDKYAVALVGNLRENPECDVIFDKQPCRGLSLTLKMVYCAAYNCQNGYVSGWSMYLFAWLAAEHEQSAVETNLPQHSCKLCGKHFEDSMVSPALARSFGYDMKCQAHRRCLSNHIWQTELNAFDIGGTLVWCIIMYTDKGNTENGTTLCVRYLYAVLT